MVDLPTSRRQVLKGAGGAALLSAAPNISRRAFAQSRGGTLVISGGFYPISMDPRMWENGEEYIVGDCIYSNLTRLTPDFGIEPELATSWEASDDAMTWTFNLRKGVKFHNGKELVADDVVFSIERALEPGTKARGAIGPIDTAEALDAYTVQIKLKSPYADLATTMAKPQIHIVPRWNDKIETNPIGTGPFKVRSILPGERIEYERFGDYFMDDLPYLDRIVEVINPQPSAALNGLVAGDIDVVWNASLDWESAIAGRDSVKMEQVASPGYNNIYMMVDREPFNDVRVRQALKHTVDREKFVSAVLNGNGTVANDHPVPPFNRYHNDSIPLRKQDHEKARQLLKEAGYPDGLTLDLYTSESRFGQLGSAVTLAQFAKPAGIEINVNNIDPGRFWSEYWKKQPFLVSNWFGRPTIDGTLRPYFHTEGVFNYAKYSDPRVDELLDKARGETDFDTRKKMYDEVQRIVHEEGPWVLPYFKNYPVAMRASVQNYPIYPNKWTWLAQVWKG